MNRKRKRRKKTYKLEIGNDEIVRRKIGVD